MNKLILLVFIFLLSTIPTVFGQNHIMVELDNPVYQLIETAELKGAIKRLSMVKPYSYSTVIELLKKTQNNSNKLTRNEIKILDHFIEQFTQTKDGLSNGNLSYKTNLQNNQVISVISGLDLLSNFRINTELSADWHMYNLVRGYLKGDLGNNISYYGSVGFTYDKVGFSTFPPYDFTKKWDAFHIGFGEARYSYTGAEDIPYFSYFLEADIAASFLENSLNLNLSRHRREWSYGEGSFSLSHSARPFVGLEVYARLAPWIGIGHLTGSLGNWALETAVKGNDTEKSYQKNYTLQTLEILPFDWLSLSTNASVVWGKRFEIGYMVPLMYSMIYQNLIGDFENVGQEVNIKFLISPFGSLYFSFFADEMEITNLEELFTRPRNMFAVQSGAKIPIPGLPFTVFTFQYTKIEPFVYSHYPEDYPFFSNPVDMSYSHDGENLGYHLPSNSDEFLIQIESLPISNVYASLKYQLIRHGTNDYTIKGDTAIYGDLNVPLQYDQLDNYPDKKFLFDGLYDWNNIVTLKGAYTFKKIPITISLEYCFSHTFWRVNNSGIPQPASEMRNIFSIQFELWR